MKHSCAGGKTTGGSPKETSRQPFPTLKQAINLDQNYGRAYAALAMIYVGSALRRWTPVLGVSDVEVDRARKYLAHLPSINDRRNFCADSDGSLMPRVRSAVSGILDSASSTHHGSWRLPVRPSLTP